MPFEEIQHTADRSVKVWAQDLPSFFAESARAMNAIAGIRLQPGPRTQRSFETTGPDAEALLVAFLSELVFAAELESLGFDEFELQFGDGSLQARMTGAPLLEIEKAIKAVTFHGLQIRREGSMVTAEIVFDV
jgi:SHS2 domain-containing protein